MPIIVDGAAAASGSSLELSAVWLNVADNPSDVAAFEYAGESINVTTTARVEVRQLAGRTRLIRRGAATAEALGVTFERCDRAQAAWLRERVGVLMCVRDHVGTKFYGVFSEVPREVDTAWRDRIRVSITLQQVTYSESV